MSLSKLTCALALTCSGSSWAAIGGLYGTPCLELENLSAVKDILLDDGSFQIVQTVYADRSCQTPAYDFSFRGHYEIDPEAGTIDLHFDAVELSALDAPIAAAFSTQELCGIKKWSADEPLDISGLNCGNQIVPRQDSVVFESIRETEKGLQLGVPDTTFTGESPELRPRSFDETVYLAR